MELQAHVPVEPVGDAALGEQRVHMLGEVPDDVGAAEAQVVQGEVLRGETEPVLERDSEVRVGHHGEGEHRAHPGLDVLGCRGVASVGALHQ